MLGRGSAFSIRTLGGSIRRVIETLPKHHRNYLDSVFRLCKAEVSDPVEARWPTLHCRSRKESKTRTQARRSRALGVLTVAAGLAVAGCSASDGPSEDGDGGPITVWTFEEQPDRIATTESIIDDFTSATGVEVDLVGTNEDQFVQLLTSAAAAGELPDVVAGVPLANIRTLSANELLDTAAAESVVAALGEETFTPTALDLTRDVDDTQLAVPSDGFPVTLVYRADLFEEVGLPVPTTYETVLEAARYFDDTDIAGFVAGTAPDTAYTQQVFEFAALANGCELVDADGNVTIDSPACIEAFEFYGELVRDHSVPGAMDSTSTKTTYMAGDAAMMMWATYVLDEMAGLVDSALPSCAECAETPAFIAENSSFVGALEGPSGSGPTGYSEVTSWAIIDGAASGAEQFVEYLMSDGYVDWLSFAPEGKFPVRTGTADDPTQFVQAWEGLDAGVDTQAPLSEFYSPEILQTLQGSLESFSRWGLAEGQGDLLGAVVGENVIPQAVAALAQGEVDAQGAAEQAAQAILAIQESMQ